VNSTRASLHFLPILNASSIPASLLGMDAPNPLPFEFGQEVNNRRIEDTPSHCADAAPEFAK
jgi:hypothetical protein